MLALQRLVGRVIHSEDVCELLGSRLVLGLERALSSTVEAAHRALRPGGYGLVVVSDNPILLQTVARSLLSLMSDGLSFEGRTGTMGGQPKVQPLHPALIGEASEKLISEGAPKGFVAAAGGAQQASRFDRMWASRAKQRRYHVRVVR